MSLEPAAYSLESAYGSVQPSRRPEDFDELSRGARDAKAKRTLQRSIAEVVTDDRDFDRVAGLRRGEP